MDSTLPLLSLSHCFLFEYFEYPRTKKLFSIRFFEFPKVLHAKLLLQDASDGVLDEHYVVILHQADDDVLRYLEREFQNSTLEGPVVDDQFHVFASDLDDPDAGSRFYQFVEAVEG